METLESEVKNCDIEIKAGFEAENSDVYMWINSPVPDWAKTVDNLIYRFYTGIALQTAEKIVRKTKRNITLKFSVEYHH